MTRTMLSLALLAAAAAHAQPNPLVGRWLTQDRKAVVAIAPCGDALCGNLVGLTLDHPGDPAPVDYRGRSQCDLPLITDIAPDGAGIWSAHITDPRDGSRYDARLEVDGQRRLRMRGYIGLPLFGRTQIWTQYAGLIGPSCAMAGPS